MGDAAKRFKIALSFPGEQRGFVKQVACLLAARFGRKSILYDYFHEPEFARANLDTYLQRLYHDESELIAVFLCADYDRKDWCGLEWRALRDLINRRQADSVMFLRFDKADIPGLYFTTDGSVWIGNRSPAEIVDMIVERHGLSDPATSRTASTPTPAPVPAPPPPALLQYNPPLVVSVLAAERWRRSLADTLGPCGIKHESYDVGHHDLSGPLGIGTFQGAIDEFYDFYVDLLEQPSLGIDPADYWSRPSVIAHGSGTYIVGFAMQKFSDIQFDKLILCDAILPVDFDWSTLFHRDQVNFVQNEFGSRDIRTSNVGRLIGDTAVSGTEGFQSMSRMISQERLPYFSHGDYFHKRHIESQWLPILRTEPSPLLVRHGRNMEGTDLEAAFTDTGAIDDLCFKDLQDFHEIPDDLADAWVEMEPDVYTFLFDRRNEKACGYINAMPVTDECFGKIERAEIEDHEITSDDIDPFLGNQVAKLYLMSVAIHPKLRRASHGMLQEPMERLVNGFINKLYYYAVHHGIRVTEIVSVGWTPPGRKLCQALGMVPKGEDKNKRPIYRLDFESGPTRSARSIFPSVLRLAAVYKQMADLEHDGKR